MTNKDQVAEALRWIDQAMKLSLEEFEDGTYIDAQSYLEQAQEKARAALRLLTAPVPEAPGAEEIEAIRARHETSTHHLSQTVTDRDVWMAQAHADRATLLAALDAERAARVEAEGKLAEVREAAGPFAKGEFHLLQKTKTRDGRPMALVHFEVPFSTDIHQASGWFDRLSAALKESGHE